MNRTLIVATTEFLTLVRTKAFIIGLAIAPIMVVVSIAFNYYAATHVDRGTHVFAVIDQTGQIFDSLSRAADEFNAKSGSGAARTGPHFVPIKIDPGSRSISDLKLELSTRVKDAGRGSKDGSGDSLFAFVIIPANAIDADSATATPIQYFTETPSYNALPEWLEETINREIASRRFVSSAVDPRLVAKLTRRTSLTTLGLVEHNADGSIKEARKTNAVETFIVPFGLMYLLFIALMSSAPPLLNAVIEEKMSKISEVLVSSVTPFQLMMGKLVGVSAIAALLALFYLGCGLYAAGATGNLDIIHPQLLGWFVVYLICAVLMFGSVFVAIGSACSDLKDAQSMMQPTMLVLLLPIFTAPMVLKDPSSPIAVGLSLFPTSTPFIMILRLAMTPAPPAWQVVASIVITAVAVVAIVWAASRIFRVGILMQGKAPSLREMIRWISA